MSASYVFAGPTVTRAEILAVLPGCTVIPPVSAGDLVRLRPRAGDVVGLIDGFFRERGAVRHKEILDLIDRGVRVLGAASMGALRAAELHPFGMEGVGEVFRLFASAELEGDDEVALLHLDEERGYRPITVPLVNMRHALARARDRDVISRALAAALVAAAVELPFGSRTYQAVFERAVRSGTPLAALQPLRSFLASARHDLKHDDALLLIEHLARAEGTPAGPRAEPNTHTSYFRLLEIEASGSGGQGERDEFVSDRDVLALRRLLDADYPAWHVRTALTLLAARYGEELGIAPPSADSLLADFRRVNQLLVPADYEAWLAARELGEPELALELRDEALAGAAAARVAGQDVGDVASDADLERAVAAYLFHLGLVATADAFPEQLELWLRPTERSSLAPARALAVAAVRALYDVQWVPRFVAAAKRTRPMSGDRARVRDTLRFNRALARESSGAGGAGVAGEEVKEWAARRWSAAPDEFEWELLDRGFRGRTSFESVASFHYLYDCCVPLPVRPGDPHVW
ncbi:MAG TPA: TfuA-like protein [Longimicrobium sp.]